MPLIAPLLSDGPAQPADAAVPDGESNEPPVATDDGNQTEKEFRQAWTLQGLETKSEPVPYKKKGSSIQIFWMDRGYGPEKSGQKRRSPGVGARASESATVEGQLRGAPVGRISHVPPFSGRTLLHTALQEKRWIMGMRAQGKILQQYRS
jgi:hypothetical protein